MPGYSSAGEVGDEMRGTTVCFPLLVALVEDPEWEESCESSAKVGHSKEDSFHRRRLVNYQSFTALSARGAAIWADFDVKPQPPNPDCECGGDRQLTEPTQYLLQTQADMQQRYS
ncbi:hypothetical protein PAAG_02697 [Paracoccidioides lutzii Pb01]|uniref:Uncharacterized protein n=1 Tax=Paracoccidioides lutzii (strain ATCC MYA-826 / Pb01) TaxID=502779 RepID=C1GW02_PARBA|nr:hypothetical protein PAAG_02697 [Paracoccidioides lutzii Pb01]EEH40722.2 hypothetical protein PAAG_02697 [Paracoccidioides lutzii Pb01]